MNQTPLFPICLSIAGSDPSGGAGLQADLKVFQGHGVYGAGVVTLLTVQNSTSGRVVEYVSGELVRAQIDAVVQDFPVSVIKTGALGTVATVEAVAEVVGYGKQILVVDPVMTSKHGMKLLVPEAVLTLKNLLLPITYLVTPNLDEAAVLCGFNVNSVADMERACVVLEALGAKNVLIKGGHLSGSVCVDVLYSSGKFERFESERIEKNSETHECHGTGCVLASSIAARLAHGETLTDAVRGAKDFVARAINTAPNLVSGFSPVNFLTRA